MKRKTSPWFIIFVIVAALVAIITAVNLWLSLSSFFEYYNYYTSQEADKATIDYYVGSIVQQQLIPAISQTVFYLAFVFLFAGLASFSQKLNDFFSIFNSDEPFSEEELAEMDEEFDYTEEAGEFTFSDATYIDADEDAEPEIEIVTNDETDGE